jgi:hypothetical protein
MTPEQYAKWAMDIIKRAQLGKLRGCVSFHFNEGTLVSAKVESNEKPLDETVKAP